MIDDEPEKSRYQQVMDEIVENQIKARQRVANYLMANPGFLSTFGEDFKVEFSDFELTTHNPVEVNPLDEWRVGIYQEIRFRRNTDND